MKDNQKRLHEAIRDYFDEAIASGKPDLCRLQSVRGQHRGMVALKRGGVTYRPVWIRCPMQTVGEAGSVYRPG
ncbi:MAG: hypothetical protein ACXWAT_09875 [Methylobacter sp.]